MAMIRTLGRGVRLQQRSYTVLAPTVEVPKELVNINAYFDYKLYSQETKKQLTGEDLEKAGKIPKAMLDLELSRQKRIPLSESLRDTYKTYRPTPFFRATKWEKHLGTSSEIWIKDEGKTPSKNHKANSALFLAKLCKEAGSMGMISESTGNWGIALGKAGKVMGIDTVCFMDSESVKKRPDRKPLMESFGMKVVVVENDPNRSDALMQSADEAVDYADRIGGSYIFGSIYGYFTVPQTMIGIEMKQALAKLDIKADVVVGSCGGGANLLGTCSAFIADHLDGKGPAPRIVSAESVQCPVVSQGVKGLYAVDTKNYYPMIETYGVTGHRSKALGTHAYIGGMGSTVVASAVSHLHQAGLLETKTYTPEQAKDTLVEFLEAEGIMVALECGYQLSAVRDVALEDKKQVIVVNISCGENDRSMLGLQKK